MNSHVTKFFTHFWSHIIVEIQLIFLSENPALNNLYRCVHQNGLQTCLGIKNLSKNENVKSLNIFLIVSVDTLCLN
jgi:hypothetical protein